MRNSLRDQYIKDHIEAYTPMVEAAIQKEVENDPQSIPKFIKADTGKTMMSLIDPLFVIELGEVLTFGAKKYAPDNWKLCEDLQRYKDALLRHTYAYLSGEEFDQETGLPHTSAIAFNIMALRWFDRKESK